MKTGMVRADLRTLEKLRRMRAGSGETTAALLQEAVDLLERERFLDSANEAFGRVREDPALSRAEADERFLWEGTLADGLEDGG